MLTSDLRAVPPASLCTKEGPSAQGWQVRCCGASPVLTMNLSKWRQCLPHCVRAVRPQGATRQNCEARGAARSALDGESPGPGWQGVARIPTGPWRPSEDPRGASQIPGLTLRHLTSFPRQSSKGATHVSGGGGKRGRLETYSQGLNWAPRFLSWSLTPAPGAVWSWAFENG